MCECFRFLLWPGGSSGPQRVLLLFFIVTGFLREARFCAFPLLLYAFHRCGFCGQILAKITMCKFRILRQCQVEALNLVDLQAQAVCGQSKDMPALRLISAEVMEVPAGQVDAVYIGRAVDSNHATVSCVLMFVLDTDFVHTLLCGLSADSMA